jgi:beta-glucosidase
MVVIHNAGIRIVDAWIENPNITAVIYAHLPGQDSGRALVNLMFGQKSFSGRMPYTVAKSASDYGTLLGPSEAGAAGTLDYFYPQSNFTEGVYIDYRAFIAQNITPQFEFGYGLTYSTFSYANLATTRHRNISLSYLPPGASKTSNTTVPTQGGLPSLWNTIASVSFTLQNTGAVTAMEVPQLYLGIPGGPAKQLRGFDKINLMANQTQSVTFKLTRRDLSEWSVEEQQWVLQRGTYGVFVGKSVLDVQLVGSLVI